MTYFIGVGCANAAVRDANSVPRKTTDPHPSTTTRTATKPASRNTAKNVTLRTTNARTVQSDTVSRVQSARTPARTTATSVTRVAKPVNVGKSSARSAIKSTGNISRPARAATTTLSQSKTFGGEYNTCRDAYFTCMDQFCANQDDSYRRCVCSSKLNQIKSRQNLLSDTANQLQDFKDFNISTIDKSAAEVNAMINATTGEAIASSANDTSASGQQLSNISAILNKAKSESLSTAGTLDIGGNIKDIWNTTNIADGANIANLTGEQLYNAVHAQCSQIVADACASKSTLNMVVSAYGMYIENDCTVLSNSLDKKTSAAKGSVRETEHEMHIARLENYNAHNSTSIHDCIANVRADLTADTACGANYVHCLDITGLYLSRDTGQPIYTSDFYKLADQISLSGNILTNQTNRLLVAELNRMRSFAATSLDTCRDISDEVWDEFVRQAITEIHQKQQQAIRTVKNECLDVVNTCYDEQNQSLKDFSNVKEQLLLGQRLELSEELCREKLNTCSNLYGGGANGLQELLNTMHNLTDAKIAQSCRVTLQEFAREMCAVPSNDTLHSYPYACRVYTPGTQEHAKYSACNQQLWTKSTSNSDNAYTPPIDDSENENIPETPSNTYMCASALMYTNCNPGYYMVDASGTQNSTPEPGNDCVACLAGHTCAGGTAAPQPASPEDTSGVTSQEKYGHDCGDYPGSLYQRLVRYALQSCVRPSDANDTNYTISTSVLADVNAVMDSIRVDMGVALATECERLGGTWVDTMWVDKDSNSIHDNTGDTTYKKFYDETGANTSWGYCALTLGNETEEKNKETLEKICTKLNGIWKSIAWVDNIKNETCCAAGVCATGDGTTGIDGCHDYNNDILLPAFYSETMVDTKAGYCAEKH